MKKTISFLTVLFMCTILIGGCSNNKQDANQQKLVVGMELAYPPFETKDSSGQPSGISVEFAKAFGKSIDREVVIENIAWDGLIPSLQSGKADMVISSMTITEERAKTVDFSDPYANASLAILSNKNANIQKIEDLNVAGKKIAVKTGSTGYLYAQNNLKNAEIIALSDESACATEVAQGKADGFIYDQLTIYRNWKINEATTSALFIPFQDVDKWGVAIKKGNTTLQNQLNSFIKQYTNDGGFDTLSTKYLAEEKQAFDELGFHWFFDLK